MTDPAKPGDNPFKLARQLTRHSQADVAEASGLSRQTINRSQSFLSVQPLCPYQDEDGKTGMRGESLRPVREAFVFPFTSLVAKGFDKA